MNRVLVPDWGPMRRTTLYLPLDQLERLKGLAEGSGRTASEQIRVAIDDYLEARAQTGRGGMGRGGTARRPRRGGTPGGSA